MLYNIENHNSIHFVQDSTNVLCTCTYITEAYNRAIVTIGIYRRYQIIQHNV